MSAKRWQVRASEDAAPHGIAAAASGAVEITETGDTLSVPWIADRTIGGARCVGRALGTSAERRASGLFRIRTVDVRDALDTEPTSDVAIRLHGIAGRAIAAARDATLIRDVADLHRIALGIGQTFDASVALEIAKGATFATSQIVDAFHAGAARTAEMFRSGAVRIRQTFDTRHRNHVAIGRGRRAIAVASARPGRAFRISGGLCGRKIDGTRVAHRAVRARYQSEPTRPRYKPVRSPIGRPNGGHGRRSAARRAGGEHAIHPYRYK